MTRQLEPTADHAGAAVGADVLSSSFLEDLRSGERDAFLRFFEAFRLPVYNFVLHLTHAGEDAAAITREVLVATYREILLHDGAVDLRPWVYRTAVGACADRWEAGVAGGRTREADPGVSVRHGRVHEGDLGRRVRQALQALDFRYCAALLLYDIHRLRLDEIGAVFGISADGAKASLFKAREAFLHAFDEPWTDQDDPTCRLAEQAVASAVGRTLSEEEVRKLREHAAYCKPCRATMKRWGAATIGLALFLKEAPLPEALRTEPVFDVASAAGGSHAAAGLVVAEAGGVLGGAGKVLATIGRALASKAAAYALAAICLAAFVGLATYDAHRSLGPTLQPLHSSAGVAAPSAAPAPRAAVADSRREPAGRPAASPAARPARLTVAGVHQAVTTTTTIALAGGPSRVGTTRLGGAATGGSASGSGAGAETGGSSTAGGASGRTGGARPGGGGSAGAGSQHGGGASSGVTEQHGTHGKHGSAARHSGHGGRPGARHGAHGARHGAYGGDGGGRHGRHGGGHSGHGGGRASHGGRHSGRHSGNGGRHGGHHDGQHHGSRHSGHGGGRGKH